MHIDMTFDRYAHPSHAIRAYTAPTNEDIFSTQYAVRSSTCTVLSALRIGAFNSASICPPLATRPPPYSFHST